MVEIKIYGWYVKFDVNIKTNIAILHYKTDTV